jgi:hypothetical protein
MGTLKKSRANAGDRIGEKSKEMQQHFYVYCGEAASLLNFFIFILQ